MGAPDWTPWTLGPCGRILSGILPEPNRGAWGQITSADCKQHRHSRTPACGWELHPSGTPTRPLTISLEAQASCTPYPKAASGEVPFLRGSCWACTFLRTTLQGALLCVSLALSLPSRKLAYFWDTLPA